MAVKIRLKRAGMPKQPNYRIVVTDSRKPRDGATIANLGHYAPYRLNKPLFVDLGLYQEWVGRGAKPTDAVKKLVKQFKKRGETVVPVPKPPKAKTETPEVKTENPEVKAEAPEVKAEAPEVKAEVPLEDERPAEEEPMEQTAAGENEISE